MGRQLVFAALVGALATAGCTTLPKTLSPEALARIIAQIQEGTRSKCSFVPTATAILAILGVPGAGAADLIIAGLCRQVVAKAGAERVTLGQPMTVTYDGIRVEGFVAR